MDASKYTSLSLGSNMHHGDVDELESSKAALLITALKSGQSIRFIALGSSMSPAILPRSWVTISPCVPSELKWGEIALCVLDHTSQDQHAWILHRVMSNRYDERCLKLGGDRLPITDDLRSYHNVLGVLTAIEPPKVMKVYTILTLVMKKAPRSLLARCLGMVSLWAYHLYSRVRRFLR